MKKQILIIEDNPDSSLIMKDTVEDLKFEPIQFYNGETAIKYIKDIKEDTKIVLVLLDYLMPGANGIEVAKALRNNTFTRNIPIVFDTVLYQHEIKSNTEGLNIKRFLRKPVDFVELEECIREELKL